MGSWPEIIVGNLISAVVGFILSKIMDAVAESPGKKAKLYFGTFYGYYYSTTGNGKVIVEEWEIRRRRLGGVGVKIKQSDGHSDFFYKSKLYFQDGFIYVNSIGIKHSEKMLHVFREPIPDKTVACAGVFVCISMSKKPFCTKHFLSRIKLAPPYSLAKDILGPPPGESIIADEIDWNIINRLIELDRDRQKRERKKEKDN